MKKLLFLLFFIWLGSIAFSQTNSMDSLKIALKNAKHDTTRCEILSALIENEYDDKIWPLYNEQLFKLAEKNLASANSDHLKNVFLKYFAQATNNKGFLAQEFGDISKALEHYYSSLKVQEQINDKKGMAITINNIAYIYMHQGDLNKSLESVKKAMKLQEDIKDSAGIALSLNNLGNIYKNKNEITKALDYFNQSLTLQRKINNQYGASVCLSNIGDYYIERGETSKGIEYILQSLKIREEMNELDGISYNLNRLATIMLDMNRLDEALKYGTRSFTVAKELNYIENIRNAAKTLYKIYKKQNNATEALKMYELYFQMHDSISNETTRKSSIKNQLQYEYEKKATSDSLRVAEEKKITSIQLKHEKTQRFALYGGLLLVALFGGVMFNRFKITQKQKHIIEKQKEIVDEKQLEILDSIHYAKRIQNALMANAEFIDQHLLNNFILFQPKDIVSGDFYWAATVERQQATESSEEQLLPTAHSQLFYLAVCDSTGHGVPGAFMSLLNMGFLSEAIKEKNIVKPNEVLDYVRQRLIASMSNEGQKDGMDGILICYDKTNNTLEYSAANNVPILIRNNQVIELAKDRMPIGKGESDTPFTLHSVDLQKGDSLYLYTDGYADQFGGEKGKKFKYKPLNELLLSVSQNSCDEQLQTLGKVFHDWKGGQEQVDDVLVIGIKI